MASEKVSGRRKKKRSEGAEERKKKSDANVNRKIWHHEAETKI